MPQTHRDRHFGATGWGFDVGPGPKIAAQGGQIQLTNPTVVYYWTQLAPGGTRFRLLAPGSHTCDDATFGGRPYGVGNDWMGCYQGPIAAGGVIGAVQGTPGAATKVADEGQAFTASEGETIWYGSSPGAGYPGNYVGHNVEAGLSFTCNNAAFGPSGAGGARSCFAVPFQAPAPGSTPLTYELQQAAQLESMQRAETAAQAARDLAAAQLAVQTEKADEAAQQAQIAMNAAAQQAAALSAAEVYHQIQKQASDQAAAFAAQLAVIAAAGAADADAANAAADMAAQAEALRQATAAARSDVARQSVANQVAQAAALTEIRKQEIAEAELQAAQDASYTQSELAAGGGGSIAGFKMSDLLLYGGLGLVALLLLTGK
jgi:hypothetical protein